MKKTPALFFLFFFLTLITFAQRADTTTEISVRTRIDPGAELITIMLWVSGKYPLPVDSQYKTDVWAHFSKYKDHQSLNRIKNTQMYPDFTEMGLLLTDFPKIRIEIPAINNWYEKKEGKENIAGILNDARVFASASNYWKFYQKHRAEYDRLENEFAAELKKKEALTAINSFFRYGNTRPRPQVTIYMEPLNNWGAHAINFERLRGEPNGDRGTFQIGPVEQDRQLPDSPLVFEGSRLTIQNVWHEASHIYLRKTLADQKERIAKLERLFNAATAAALASQNIKTWDYALEENIVRAIVAVITKQKFGDDAYKREIAGQTQRGFIYTNEIATLVLEKYISGTADFDAFMPEILAMLETKQSPADAKK